MQFLLAILAFCLMQFGSSAPVELSTRSDFYDLFGPVRADKFSIVLYSKTSVINSGKFLPSMTDNLFINITTVTENYHQLAQCPHNQGPWLNWTSIDPNNLGYGPMLDSKVDLFPASMCVLNKGDGASSYSGTLIAYDGSTTIPLKSEDCGLRSPVDGSQQNSNNASAGAIMRCVLDTTPLCARPGASNCPDGQ